MSSPQCDGIGIAVISVMPTYPDFVQSTTPGCNKYTYVPAAVIGVAGCQITLDGAAKLTSSSGEAIENCGITDGVSVTDDTYTMM